MAATLSIPSATRGPMCGWLAWGVQVVLWLTAAAFLALTPLSAAAQDDYRVAAGDRVKITVFGEEDLSGEFELDGGGVLSFPLIGAVNANGLSPRELETALVQRLRPDYLVNPRITVEVLNYRDFFIIGEVNAPGPYPYRAGLSVLNAVALAGGFTFRANERNIEIMRGESTSPIDVSTSTMVQPGDTIRVKERFF